MIESSKVQVVEAAAVVAVAALEAVVAHGYQAVVLTVGIRVATLTLGIFHLERTLMQATTPTLTMVERQVVTSAGMRTLSASKIQSDARETLAFSRVVWLEFQSCV